MKTNRQHTDVAIIGGGLAGLTAGAYLAAHGKSVTLIERGQLGGRAMSMTMKGFNFNFGAHAIYGRDKSYLADLEKVLNLSISWADFSQTKAKYDLGNDMTDIPASIGGLMQTKLLKGMDKVRFAYHVANTMFGFEKGDPNVSIAKWLEQKNVSPGVRKMMLNLASSNFFTGEPEKIPSDVFFQYYRRLFKTNVPVSYIQGGWQTLIDEFVRKIEENGGDIHTKVKAKQIEMSDKQIKKIYTNKGEITADQFVFAVPPNELMKLFSDTDVETLIEPYSKVEPTYVMFYDLGLDKRIESPYTYIFDKEKQMFITDISYYDQQSAPDGGQLLQAVAYLTEQEAGDSEAFEQKKRDVESFYDKHFPGWRDHLVIPRVSKKATVQALKWTMEQRGLPTHFAELTNGYFVGDWCQGTGQLSELSFSSATNVAETILRSHATRRGA
ncbi:phytoene desaturase family protein [Texcoconibacillus texcoconensis]|uniref:Phytoene dehydrogenase-like protein n=1 Tax=Texcoconibacillus texcoconensis TaxID=1095777 RepID=A0A840QNU5_9BACI|nr:FAD-dependent oxidoreductase [Texcoconibacillus texcoconensis]MBB5173007.1 phytoene dehydrogenase-like protein [Texcoconibacillus texcoconensis]